MNDAPLHLDELRRLEAELESDLMYCTTRDAHLRLATRLSSLRAIISAYEKARVDRDTTDLRDTVVL